MDDRGLLVAVDPKEKRIRGLLANVYRLGHPNVLVIAADGRTFPTTALFDRVLVDAPCSAEGTLRRKSGRAPRRSPGFVAYVTSLQEALLRRAILLTRPGGVIVYSTCTFAPEENEAVLTRVLEDSPVRIEAIDLDVPHAPGLLAWDGVRFHDDLERAWRVYPHHLDSGGLFMVRLRRIHPVTPDLARPEPTLGWSPPSVAFPGESPHRAARRITEAVTELESWFALHALPSDLRWIVRGDNIWAHTAESWPVPAWKRSNPPTAWRIVSFGIRALRRRAGHGETPSNRFLARWGRELGADRKIRLSTDELLQLLEGNGQSLPVERLHDGVHALEWEGMVLGRGIVGARGLTHEIPKALATRLHHVLSEGRKVDGSES
jgi:hypothetical protein